MLRFVDLRDQIIDVEDAPIAFTFYDTVRDVFIDLVGHGPVYTSLKDFEEELESSDRLARSDGRDSRFEKERFMRLLPTWVSGKARPDVPCTVGEARVVATEQVVDQRTRELMVWLCDRVELLEHQMYLEENFRSPEFGGPRS